MSIISFATLSRAIKTDTAKGNPIDNEQRQSALTLHELHTIKELSKKYLTVTTRTNPILRYNCHGMTFASRRTAICEAKEIIKILQDDGYVEVKSTEVLEGDIVVYYAADGDVEHSGVVVKPAENSLSFHKVMSKWGFGQEVIHFVRDCPYYCGNIHYFRVDEV